jgi:hypothetical protein
MLLNTDELPDLSCPSGDHEKSERDLRELSRVEKEEVKIQTPKRHLPSKPTKATPPKM